MLKTTLVRVSVIESMRSRLPAVNSISSGTDQPRRPRSTTRSCAPSPTAHQRTRAGCDVRCGGAGSWPRVRPLCEDDDVVRGEDQIADTTPLPLPPELLARRESRAHLLDEGPEPQDRRVSQRPAFRFASGRGCLSYCFVEQLSDRLGEPVMPRCDVEIPDRVDLATPGPRLSERNPIAIELDAAAVDLTAHHPGVLERCLRETDHRLGGGHLREALGEVLGHAQGRACLDAAGQQDVQQVVAGRRVLTVPGEVDDKGGQVGPAVQQLFDSCHGGNLAICTAPLGAMTSKARSRLSVQPLGVVLAKLVRRWRLGVPAWLHLQATEPAAAAPLALAGRAAAARCGGRAVTSRRAQRRRALERANVATTPAEAPSRELERWEPATESRKMM